MNIGIVVIIADTAVLNAASQRMTRGIGSSSRLCSMAASASSRIAKSLAAALHDGCRPPLPVRVVRGAFRHLDGKGPTVRMPSDCLEQFRLRAGDEGVVEVARERAAQGGDGIADGHVRIRRGFSDRRGTRMRERCEQRHCAGSVALGLDRCQVPHLHVVLEHPAMEGDDPGGEQLDFRMLLGIEHQLLALGGDSNARPRRRPKNRSRLCRAPPRSVRTRAAMRR